MPANRGPTRGPWGRLKPTEQDPLDSIGLPSKGDTRLLDPKLQERYYTRIVERYLSFCSDTSDNASLLDRFAALNLASASTSPSPPSHPPGHPSPSPSGHTPPPGQDLSTILLALRKLREGLVATARADDFAVQAYLFCIRLAILARRPDAYHAPLLHLLRRLHPRHALTSLELAEAAAYLVLDTACRRGEVGEARALWAELGPAAAARGGGVDGGSGKAGVGGMVEAVLRALVGDNWVAFARLRRAVDAHAAVLMGWAEGEMRTHTLKCFGRTYLSVEVEFLERATGMRFSELKARCGVGWELEGGMVVIRKVPAKKA